MVCRCGGARGDLLRLVLWLGWRSLLLLLAGGAEPGFAGFVVDGTGGGFVGRHGWRARLETSSFVGRTSNMSKYGFLLLKLDLVDTVIWDCLQPYRSMHRSRFRSFHNEFQLQWFRLNLLPGERKALGLGPLGPWRSTQVKMANKDNLQDRLVYRASTTAPVNIAVIKYALLPDTKTPPIVFLAN